MKKFFVLLAFCGSVFAANAQSEVGSITLQPKVGINLASMTDYDDSKMKVGLVAGVEAAYQLSDVLAVSAGLNYSMQGVKGDGDAKIKTEYINIPILANYYVAPGLAIKAGVQPGFLMSCKMDDGEGDVDAKDFAEKFDLSIPVGVSYEISDFVIDARYNFGLTNIWKDDYKDLLGDSKNSVISLTVGYKFGL